MNTEKKILIIGGVAGGASAAARARRLSESSSITIIEKGPYVSFANCGMPYHIGGIIPERSNLLVQTPRSLKERFNINVRINTEAVAIDRGNRTVSVIDAANGVSGKLSYDKLILAPGAEAFKPPMTGVDLPGVFTLQTMTDLDAIMKYLTWKNIRRAVVIGGGFIGLEAAENFTLKSIKVSIVEADSQVLPSHDPEMAELLHQHLLDHGIALHLEKKASGIVQKGSGLTINLADGASIDTDIVLLAIGVRPRTKLAKDAGLEIGVTGGIRVDDRMVTSDPDIFAVGDAIEITNPATGLPGFIPLAGPANRQGRIAADQIFGRDSRYRGTLGTSICKVFELGAGAVGVSEKVLKKLGKVYQKSYVHAGSHANYYPGSYSIALKLLFDPKAGTIYGAQAIGGDGVDKRIDVIASAMYAGLTVFDLEHFELSYSPPFGAAKDPVNMAGFVAANIIRGDHLVIHADALSAEENQGAILLDVRNVGEHRAGNIEGSLNIPVNELRGRISELPAGKKIIVYCQVGLRGYIAQRMLTLSGFDAVNLSGGYKTWMMVNRLLSRIR